MAGCSPTRRSPESSNPVDLQDSEGRLYKVTKKRCLYSYFIQERKKVLFVGEGNFTFTVAFAALREYHTHKSDPWKGITFTSEEKQQTQPFRFNAVKVSCIKNSTDWCHGEWREWEKQDEMANGKQTSPVFKKLEKSSSTSYMDSSDDVILKIRALAELPMPGNCHLKYDYNALKPLNASNSDGSELLFSQASSSSLSSSSDSDSDSNSEVDADFCFDAVWFQCPWSGNPGKLVEDFLLNAARYTREGEYVCVGITNHDRYVRRYCLENVLGRGLRGTSDCTEVLKHYDFLGADTDLIYRVLSFGYQHHVSKDIDIHDFILEHHATLVFERKEKASCTKRRKMDLSALQGLF